VSASLDKPLDGGDKFADFVSAVRRAHRVRDTALDVALHDLEAHLLQRAPGGRDLLQDINAVALLLHHPLQPVDLACDALQAFETLRLIYTLRHSIYPLLVGSISHPGGLSRSKRTFVEGDGWLKRNGLLFKELHRFTGERLEGLGTADVLFNFCRCFTTEDRCGDARET